LRTVANADAPLVATPVADADLGRALAWRDGRIAFEGETLAAAAAEFARYSETRIVFADAAIAEEPVTGLFVSTDPVGFARAVAVAFDLEAETREGEVRLSRRSKPEARRGG
jgi:transmembrane sensor